MSVSPVVQDFFRRKGVTAAILPHARTDTLQAAAQLLDIPGERFSRAVVLASGDAILMAVVPLSSVLDLDAVAKTTGKSWEPVTGSLLARLFPDCEPGSLPPLPAAYGLDGLIDEGLFRQDMVHFEAGSHTSVCRVDQRDFRTLHAGCRRYPIAAPLSHQSGLCPKQCEELFEKVSLPSPTEVEERLRALYRLPALPVVATEVLKITRDPDASLDELVFWIKKDPSLTAQIMRYARSAYFGYAGEVDSLETAVVRVLGFDVVANLAIGICAGKAFDWPVEGPLGQKKFWRNALFAATLMQRLARRSSKPLKPGLAYLAGLLHNFGILLLAHLFQPEFFLLNRLAEQYPHCSLNTLERRMLHCGGSEGSRLNHTELGASLLQHWEMPPEIVGVCRGHHDPETDDSEYLALAQVALGLLADSALSDVGQLKGLVELAA
jgi:HD-like signal output (HDOD) protein/prolyl-tRNA editing enzyme YbaK/EbsC (Cys-tRNA(Pro) deacylase)